MGPQHYLRDPDALAEFRKRVKVSHEGSGSWVATIYYTKPDIQLAWIESGWSVLGNAIGACAKRMWYNNPEYMARCDIKIFLFKKNSLISKRLFESFDISNVI